MRTITVLSLATCGAGAMWVAQPAQAVPPPQSPVNFSLPNYDGTLPTLTFTYNAINIVNGMKNEGSPDPQKSVKITVGANDGRLVVAAHVKDGQNIAEKTYRLKEFHFHTKAEHQLNGFVNEMEVHMVHENIDDANDKLAVGRWITEQAAANADMAPIFGALPASGASADIAMDLAHLLPAVAARNAYYRYDGSLTTGQVDGVSNTAVKWYFLDDKLKLGAAQIAAFRALFNGVNGNAHEVQALSPAHKLRTNVPAPAAAVALALGGLVVSRRRRAMVA